LFAYFCRLSLPVRVSELPAPIDDPLDMPPVADPLVPLVEVPAPLVELPAPVPLVELPAPVPLVELPVPLVEPPP